jgi:hypothetical protein
MLITGDDYEYTAFVKARLSEQFHMSDLGPLSYFLGIEVTSTLDYLSQRKYIHDLLDRVGLTDHRSVDTPMSFTLAFVPQTVFLLRIPLAIVTLSVVLFISASLVLTFPMPFTS